MNRARHGFSVLELIIVVAIVAIILGLGFGFAGSYRERAKVLSCQSNMAQIGKAALSFAAETGFMPGWQKEKDLENNTGIITHLTVYRHIIPYFAPGKDIEMLSKAKPLPVFQCPEDDSVFGEAYDRGYKTSYLYNLVEMTTGTDLDAGSESGVTTSDSEHSVRPRSLGFFSNPDNWGNGINAPVLQELITDWTPWEEEMEGSAYRHFKKRGASGEGSNVVFLDGHVEFVPANPDDLEFENGFEFFIGVTDPNSSEYSSRFWVRWFARKY